MARIVVPAFLDPSNTATSLQASASRVINEYLEAITPGQGKSPVWSVRTPGIRPFCRFPDGPIRGLFEINERLFAVGGSVFAEVYSSGAVGPSFPVANDGRPATFASSGKAGHQVMVCSGNYGYIYDLNANTLTQITDPNFPFPARKCEFMDEFFLVLQGGGSTRFQWSEQYDGFVWPESQGAARSEASDNLASLIRNHREIWLVGGRTTEVWYNTGDLNNTFQPLQGVFIEHGATDPYSVQRVDNTLMWVGSNADGGGIVWRMDGYTPKRVSTFAVETALQRLSYLSGMVAYVYQMNGHVFYVIYEPDAMETSWVYDITMDRWHEWGTWNPTTCVYEPHVAGCHAYVFWRHFVGSRVDNTIYEMRQDYTDEQITGI